MAPGDVYSDLRSLKLGDPVQAKDRGGFWYNAKIIAKRSSGARTSVTVRFVHFSKSHDESFTAKQQKLRERLPKKETDAENDAIEWAGKGDMNSRNDDGTWQVERVLRTKGKGKNLRYLVRWAGWDAEYDSWLPRSALSADLIDEYKTIVEALAKARRRPPKQPKSPFSSEEANAETPEARAPPALPPSPHTAAPARARARG